MRRIAMLTLLLAATANAAWTNEVLVLASAPVTVSSAQNGQHGLLVQNRGPNSIFCASNGETPVLNKSIEIKSGGSLSFAGTAIYLKCIAATADQVTTAATITMAVP